MCKKPAHTGCGRRKANCVWGRGLEAFHGRLQKSLFFVGSETGWEEVARRGSAMRDERLCFSRTGTCRAASAAARSCERIQQTPLFDEREPGSRYIGTEN